MTAQRIFDAVKLYGSKIGVLDLAQHDLQRTFGKLANKGRAALEQIRLSFGPRLDHPYRTLPGRATGPHRSLLSPGAESRGDGMNPTMELSTEGEGYQVI